MKWPRNDDDDNEQAQLSKSIVVPLNTNTQQRRQDTTRTGLQTCCCCCQPSAIMPTTDNKPTGQREEADCHLARDWHSAQPGTRRARLRSDSLLSDDDDDDSRPTTTTTSANTPTRMRDGATLVKQSAEGRFGMAPRGTNNKRGPIIISRPSCSPLFWRPLSVTLANWPTAKRPRGEHVVGLSTSKRRPPPRRVLVARCQRNAGRMPCDSTLLSGRTFSVGLISISLRSTVTSRCVMSSTLYNCEPRALARRRATLH